MDFYSKKRKKNLMLKKNHHNLKTKKNGQHEEKGTENKIPTN
jgi:hypothetical protein